MKKLSLNRQLSIPFAMRFALFGICFAVLFTSEIEAQNGKDALTIDGNGNIGIGTTQPRGAFDVATNGNIYLNSSTNSGTKQRVFLPGEIWISPWNQSNTAFIQARRENGQGDASLQIRTMSKGQTIDAMFIDPVGRVGIGIKSPRGIFDVGKDYVHGNSQNVYLTPNTNEGTQQTTFLSGDIFLAPYNKTDVSYLQARREDNSGSTELQVRTVNKGTLVEAMKINSEGNVGIGTTTPTQAKLVVRGGVGFDIGSFTYFARANPNNGGASGSSSIPYSIYATNRIAAIEFNAFSDARIKNIQGISDGKNDLQTLMDIAVTDYSFIDQIGKGSGLHKKVIAQQVEQVYPAAVQQITDVVPDIYQLAVIHDAWIQLSTNLKQGERVKILQKSGVEELYEVLEVKSDAFRTSLNLLEDTVFVFGRQVNDFRSVDYDAIAMLNVSATQQIKKEKDAEILALQNKIAALEAREKAQTSILQDVLSRLSALEGQASEPQKAQSAMLK